MSSTRSKRASARIRKRPISFGNPALGTYHGDVYTVEGDHDNIGTQLLAEGVVTANNLVAMVDVPPEQVPEGVLNLARSHRPLIDHMRVVIAEGNGQVEAVHRSTETDVVSEEARGKPLASYTFAGVNAASILASDVEVSEAAIDPKAHMEQLLEDDGAEHHPCRTYLVLLEACSPEAAKDLVQDLRGMPYTFLDETQTCSVFHVVALEGADGVSLMSPFFAPSTKATDNGHLEISSSHSSDSRMEARNRCGSVDCKSGESEHPSGQHQRSEDYNCAVCLEHMDMTYPRSGERTSILTTVCNHSFHMDCLLQWQDSPCPVCRFDHSGLNEALSQCHLCGSTAHNYVCLICGIVSCSGGPRSSSAAADTETQHVWDFAGQGYVHRLLQNKEDGKLVEVHDPYNTTSQERSLSPGLSESQEGEVVHRKLEGFASQYYTLLKSQLEQQRIFYEGRLEEIRRDYDVAKPLKKSTDLIAALKQERNQLSQRLVTLETRRRKVLEDVSFLVSMNESLVANKEPLRRQIEEAQQQSLNARRTFEELLQPLQDKVTALMLQLEDEESDKKPAAL
ncbi:predicted protein [Phaeodactylum tricornutum CCAP 1055/1]|uniref:RING-type domain-containing protein n=2 Tax=Phaeodactylum tricornutum TaxID=2850 RepID=B7G0B6_PHATC|nr:predicted protein [Phaeodactylum tricornutum CCAP 1055/1]EEC48058.1 predicted protein [Phaeodactylum tricornutum CCAP 1055/1]|eukprot:XP_002180650.1 predicted protein [Phaeodactylum tricornutum CCAP 1055/1]